MTQAELIERVVQEVVRRLRELSASSGDSGNGDGRLRVEQRVVTLAALRNRLDGVKQLVVRSDAVITPLLRDELRDRNITLVRGQV